MKPFRKVGILGAGVMGAQIAAHCANAQVPVVLFDLTGKKSPNEVGEKALAMMKKLEPAPFGNADTVDGIELANYDFDLEKLGDCDLIIEAIAEKMEWKKDLYQKIAPHINAHAIVVSNTSGLSINALAENLMPEQRPRFCGVHFFNPPRYMALVELIPTASTTSATLDRLDAWLTTRLGKNIVRAKDTPNFIANRIGVFSLLAVMHHTRRLGLGFDEVDALTGPLIGRPKSASYRTCDVVGLDTMMHVIATMHATLPNDPWHRYYQAPDWLSALIVKGALGQKTNAGIFRKSGKTIEVLDLAQQDYRPSGGVAAEEVVAILKDKDASKRFAALRASKHPHGQLLWSIFCDIFQYSAHWLNDIAESAREVDQAMRWGFGWNEGPFETWQRAGWASIAQAVAEDIQSGKTMSPTPLPDWVATQNGVHFPEGSYSAAKSSLLARHKFPHLARQLAPSRLYGELPADNSASLGKTVFAQAEFRLWEHPINPRIVIASFQSKMHSMGPGVIEGLAEAVARAERDYEGMVIWHEAPFAVGANLKMLLEQVQAQQWALIDQYINAFQQTMLQVKYASVPIVSAVQGLALGGGCELVIQSPRRVMAFESYVGLVEAGVGVIPAGGGCKEMAMRAAYLADRTNGKDPYAFLEQVFVNIAQGQVSKSALMAKSMGYSREGDVIAMNADELLYIAIHQASAMAQAGYGAPNPSPRQRKIAVAGRAGIANCEMMLVNMQAGNMISEHDYRVSQAIATAICGGAIEKGTVVHEQWLLDVEREQFLNLVKTTKTAERIQYMLEKGKPLRN
jgi:3-hydroxyacyl-CoA dehydrogenase